MKINISILVTRRKILIARQEKQIIKRPPTYYRDALMIYLLLCSVQYLKAKAADLQDHFLD
jgi:hypothetical protein